MRERNIVRMFIFIIVFFVILQCVSNIFVRKGNGYGSDVISFYELEENILDVIFFGSSHSYATFSPDIIYDETGLKSYNFATQQQPLYITYHYMLEALKTQKPKVFVMDIRGASVQNEYMPEGVTRDALDRLRPSFNKYKAIDASVKNFDEKCTYYFNIIKYHSRYNELTEKEIKNGFLQQGIDNQGYTALEKNGYEINNEEINKIQEIKDISTKNKEYLIKIIELAKENNINLIFVKSPCQMTLDEKMYYNAVAKIASENDITFIDYTTKIDELNLCFDDFYDKGHVSYSGSAKVSLDFSNRLKEVVF